MKFNITGKLVAVLSLTSVLLVAAMATAIYWSFQKGFISYLTELELERLDQTVADLSAAYRITGSWNFLHGNHEAWMEYLPIAKVALPPKMPSNRPTTAARPGQPYLPPLAPQDQTGLSTRLRLLDADKNNIIGPPSEGDNALLRPIQLDQNTVGWLSLSPLPVPESDLDRRFRDQQLQAIYPIAGGALLLALAWRAIRAIAQRRAQVVVTYPSGHRVRARRGLTLLEMSREAGPEVGVRIMPGVEAHLQDAADEVGIVQTSLFGG